MRVSLVVASKAKQKGGDPATALQHKKEGRLFDCFAIEFLAEIRNQPRLVDRPPFGHGPALARNFERVPQLLKNVRVSLDPEEESLQQLSFVSSIVCTEVK